MQFLGYSDFELGITLFFRHFLVDFDVSGINSRIWNRIFFSNLDIPHMDSNFQLAKFHQILPILLGIGSNTRYVI